MIPSVSFLFKTKTFYSARNRESQMNSLQVIDQLYYLSLILEAKRLKTTLSTVFKSQFLGIKTNLCKMWKAIFTKFSLILKTKRLFRNQSLMLDADQLFATLLTVFYQLPLGIKSLHFKI